MIKHNLYYEVGEVLDKDLSKHEKHNAALLFVSQINELMAKKEDLGLSISQILDRHDLDSPIKVETLEDIRVQLNDLKRRILGFVDILEFEPGWVVNLDRINGYLKWVKESQPHSLDPDERYTCDRYDSISTFRSRFNQSDAKLRFYFITGEDRESPQGLYKRLGKKEIPQYVSPATGPLPSIYLEPEIKDKQYNRTNLLKEFYSILQLDVNIRSLEDAVFSDLKESPKIEEEEAIVIGFLKRVENWTPYSAALLEWFINDFCKAAWSEKAPTFIFIFQIVYPSSENGRPNRSMRRKIRRIRKALNRIGNLTLLGDLPPVKRAEIRSWVEKHVERESYGKREALIEAHFGTGNTFHMHQVEDTLSQIIQEHNQKKYN